MVDLKIKWVLFPQSSCPQQWKKAEEKLQKELLEAEATESKDKKIKLVSAIRVYGVEHFLLMHQYVIAYLSLIPAHRDAEHRVPHLLQNTEESPEVHLTVLRIRRSCEVRTMMSKQLYYSVITRYGSLFM